LNSVETILKVPYKKRTTPIITLKEEGKYGGIIFVNKIANPSKIKSVPAV
jgi:hypothetical protein